ncbi:MAG: hypothetical protein JJE52_05550 [Acidimicrobiia bacterium]|nr:hypothetical protein [Acidimicrobiia bacterium]
MATSSSKSPADTLASLKTLLVDYAKQETIDPLRGIGRYLGFGLSGAVLVGVGLLMLALAGLRALQTETGSTFTGNLSWIPYLIILAGLGVAIALLARAITRGGRPA